MNILAFWPIIKWVLQALGFMGPEDKDAERQYKLKLLDAQARKDEALTKAFSDFQTGQGQLLKTLQAVLVTALYYDVFWGARRSVSTATDLYSAGIPGLLIMSILLFPFYGPALVSGVSRAFDTMIDLSVRRVSGTPVPSTPVLKGKGDEGSQPRSPNPYTSGTGFKRTETDPEVGSFGNDVR